MPDYLNQPSKDQLVGCIVYTSPHKHTHFLARADTLKIFFSLLLTSSLTNSMNFLAASTVVHVEPQADADGGHIATCIDITNHFNLDTIS